MSKISRRSLARWSVEQLLAGHSAKNLAAQLAAVLVAQDQATEAEFLLNDIAAELERRRELVVAKVVSAAELPEQLRRAIAGRIKESSRAKAVLVEARTDRALIGGLRIETAGRVWDNTVARQLADLREALG